MWAVREPIRAVREPPLQASSGPRGPDCAGGSWMWDSCVGEHPAREGERQSYDVGVVATDPLYEGCGASLHGVPSGLADALSVADVGLDLGWVEGPHAHPGHGVAQAEIIDPCDGDS